MHRNDPASSPLAHFKFVLRKLGELAELSRAYSFFFTISLSA